MNEEKVFRLIVEMNPVPDADALDSPLGLTELERRSPTMGTRTTRTEQAIETRPGGSRSKGLVVGLVTAAAVLIVGIGGWALFNSNSETELASSPQAIAEMMVTALDEHDVDTALGLLADDPEILVMSLDTPEAFRDLFRGLEVLDFGFEGQGCVVSEAGEALCTTLERRVWSDAAQVEPVPSELRMTIVDGRITVLVLDHREFLDTVWVPFLQFVEAKNPADIERLYNLDEEGRVAGGPKLTDEALELVDQYSKEYAASLAGDG